MTERLCYDLNMKCLIKDSCVEDWIPKVAMLRSRTWVGDWATWTLASSINPWVNWQLHGLLGSGVPLEAVGHWGHDLEGNHFSMALPPPSAFWLPGSSAITCQSWGQPTKD